MQARAFASNERRHTSGRMTGRGPASGRHLFLPKRSEVAAMRLRAAELHPVRTHVRAETELAGVCPSGRAPTKTPASRRALHPPGQGCGCPRVAIGLPPGGGRPRRCRQLLCAANPVFNEHPVARPSLDRRNPSRFPETRLAEPSLVTLPLSPLRRSQGRADHRTRTPVHRGRHSGLE